MNTQIPWSSSALVLMCSVLSSCMVPTNKFLEMNKNKHYKITDEHRSHWGFMNLRTETGEKSPVVMLLGENNIVSDSKTSNPEGVMPGSSTYFRRQDFTNPNAYEQRRLKSKFRRHSQVHNSCQCHQHTKGGQEICETRAPHPQRRMEPPTEFANDANKEGVRPPTEKNWETRSKPKLRREKLRILIIGDETIDFLSDAINRGNCKIFTESYFGLTVTAAKQRMIDVFSNGDRNPDGVIIHAGANDIIDDLPSITSLVSNKLKDLADAMRELKDASNNEEPKIFAISGILPKNLPVTTFNNKVNVINSESGWYAQSMGIEYIDHSHVFWENGALKRNLYRFDGTLNEDGMRQVEESLFDGSWCQETNGYWLHKPRRRYKKKPSLELKDILPDGRKEYDKHLPPKKDGKPTTVYFHVTVLSVDSIDEESMTYVADIFLAQSWTDYRLRLPENMTEDYRILDVGWLQYIWRPDSFFKNAKKVTFHEMSVPNHYLWLYYDKTLLYMAKLTLELSCAMKFEAYPHDTQNCTMMIESLSHTTDDLVFCWNATSPLVVSDDIELPQLDIVESTIDDCTLEYSTGNFTCLAVVFNLKRRLGYHLFHTYVPTTLIVVMSWISFWIRPEAIPARVTLGVTSLLTLATQNTQSQSSLPPVSYVKAIDVWMSSCTVFVFMSLMEFAVVNHYMGFIANTRLIRGLCVDELDKQLFHRMNGITATRKTSLTSLNENPRTCCEMDVAIAIDKFSRIFFPLSFLFLNLIYWFTYAGFFW